MSNVLPQSYARHRRDTPMPLPQRANGLSVGPEPLHRQPDAPPPHHVEHVAVDGDRAVPQAPGQAHSANGMPRTGDHLTTPISTMPPPAALGGVVQRSAAHMGAGEMLDNVAQGLSTLSVEAATTSSASYVETDATGGGEVEEEDVALMMDDDLDGIVLLGASHLPNSQALNANGAVPMGALLTPLHIPADRPPALRKPPTKCYKCSAFLNCFCTVHVPTGTWTCTFCGYKNRQPGLEPDTSPELSHLTVDYVDPARQPIGGGGAPAVGKGPLYVFVVDDTMAQTQMAALKPLLAAAADALSPQGRVALVTFSNTVAVWRLGSGGGGGGRIAADGISSGGRAGSGIGGGQHHSRADLFPGHSSLTEDDEARIRAAASGEEAIFPAVCDGTDAFLAALSCLRGGEGNDDVCSRRRRALGVALEAAVAISEGAAIASRQRPVPGGERGDVTNGSAPSSGGAAALLADDASTNGQVLLFLGGACNYGPGAFEQAGQDQDEAETEAEAHCRAVAAALSKVRTSVHVFGVGYAPVGLQVLHSAVLQTGGKALLYTDYGDDTLSDVRACLAQASWTRVMAVELITSPTLFVTRIIGPSVALDDNVAGGSGAHGEITGSGSRSGVNWTRCSVGDITSDACFAVYFDVGDTPDDHVYIQVSVSYAYPSGEVLQRVVSIDVPTTGNQDLFVGSVEPRVTGVLAAKQLVLDAHKTRDPDVVSAHIDEKVLELADNFSQFFPNFEGRSIRILPPELSGLVYAMYSLKIGPMLSPILQHQDNIDALRFAFLHAPPAASVRMLTPAAIMYGGDGSEEIVNCETLALQSDKILLVDQQTDIFVWSGRETLGPEYDELRQWCVDLATERASKRYPRAVVKAFAEGSSMARWLPARMVPSHKDRFDLQKHFFPQIADLNPTYRASLYAKLPKTDMLSLHQWLLSYSLCIGVYKSNDQATA